MNRRTNSHTYIHKGAHYLTTEQTHQQIVKYRNKDVAHTPIDAYEPTTYVYTYVNKQANGQINGCRSLDVNKLCETVEAGNGGKRRRQVERSCSLFKLHLTYKYKRRCVS